MSEDVFAFIEKRLQEAEESLNKAKIMRDILKEAGEDTTEYDRQIKELEDKIRRFQEAIRKVRGF